MGTYFRFAGCGVLGVLSVTELFALALLTPPADRAVFSVGTGTPLSLVYVIGVMGWAAILGYAIGRAAVLGKQLAREATKSSHEKTIERAIRYVRKRDGK